MAIKRINGLTFEKMVRNALANLQNNESQINDMNVFPVTDGDTGTNMILTLANGVNFAQSNAHLGNYLKQLSEGMLLGARGNSGVILSQIFKGFFEELESDSIADVSELRDAFVQGYKTAYRSVTRPVEGTILTVAREGIENIKSQIGRNVYVPNLFSMYLAELRKSLAHTPEMLPVLREAKVVDSGGYGYVLLIEGMEKSLYGEEIVPMNPSEVPAPAQTAPITSFDENSAFELGYCMEFLLQKMKGRKSLNQDDYTKELNTMGDSLVVVQTDTVVKVHIHTKNPAAVISYSQTFGEFLTFKLENMQLQHDELLIKKQEAEHKPMGIIAISNGTGVAELLESFACDVVIDGGKTMNTSAAEILDAIRSISADKILIYPNHENIFKAAEQAVEMSGLDNVMIMPSKSVVECYYSLAMDMGEPDVEQRAISLAENCKAVTAVSVTRCAKDCVCGGIACVAGQLVVIQNGAPIGCVESYEAVIDVLKESGLFSDKDACIIFTGLDVCDFDEEKFQGLIESASPLLDVSFVDGQQRIYDLMIGLV